MSTFERDFKRAIEDLCKKHNCHVDYIPVGADPQVYIMARIRCISSGRKVEVILTGKEYRVIVPETDMKETVNKNDLNGLVDSIMRLLEPSVANQ
jgi:hypothetical protein